MEDKRNAIIAENILSYIKRDGITQKELADAINIAPSTLTDYLKLRSNPSHGVIQRIADYFEIAKSDIDTTYKDEVDTKIDLLYNQLNKQNQKKVYHYMHSLLDLQNTVNEPEPTYNVRKLYKVETIEKLSAGTGYHYDEANTTDCYYTDRDDLKSYNLATVVNGNSMEPKFHNGDVVLIQQGYDNEDGAIYAVDYDGESYLKRVYLRDNQFIMRSINPIYEDIKISLPIEGGEYLNIIGRVVDSFTPIKEEM